MEDSRLEPGIAELGSVLSPGLALGLVPQLCDGLRRTAGRLFQTRRAFSGMSLFKRKAKLVPGRTALRAAGSLREATESLLECQSFGRWQDGLDILRAAIASMVKVDVIAMSIAMSMAQKAAAWASSVTLQEEMSCRTITPNEVTMGTLLGAYGKAMKWQEAVNLGRAPSLVAFNAALSTCRAQWRLTLEMLFTTALQRLPSDVVSYNTVTSAIVGTWTLAAKLVVAITEASLRQNVIGSNAAMAACSTSSAWREAMDLMDVMNSQGIQPTVITSNSLGTAGVRGSCWQLATVIQDLMLARKLAPDGLSFNVLLSAADRAEKPWTAMKLLSHVKRWHVQLSPISFGSAASACSRGILWTGALHLLSRMAAVSMNDAEVRNIALLACSRSMSWRWTTQLLQGVQIQDEVAAIAAVSAQEEAGHWKDAITLLKQCCLARLISSASLHVSVCSACTRGRQWERSILLWEAMRSMGFVADTAAHGTVLDAENEEC
eukprot:symbB.v1.2.020165.t1/scaffold1649.1/size108312/8